MASALTASVRRNDMTMDASAIDLRSTETLTRPARRDGEAFASVEVHRDIDAVRKLWTDLLPLAFATPYQRVDLMQAWADHAAAHEGVSPAIVVARDGAGVPVALLPFGVKSVIGVKVGQFLGGTHVNYNLPVIRRDRLDGFTGAECARLMTEAARAAGVDAFALANQPYVWSGVANPFAALPHQPSPDMAYSGPLASSLEEHINLFVSAKSRSNQRRKMRRFEERGAPRIYRAETREERRRLLDAYFAQKARQFAGRGMSNVFEKPGVHEFLADAAGLTGGAPAIDLFGFDMDDEVVAVMGGVADGARYCGMFISITDSEHAKYSPGEMLMNFVVEDSIRRGLSTFDLGVGAATYKKAYCPNAEPLFESIYGVTLKGRAAAAIVSAAAALKANIKANPRAYGLIEKARRLRARRADAPACPDAQSAD